MSIKLNPFYEYAMGITSQFYFCGLPLRLDSYSSCQFNCLYCFAKARGGNISNSIKIANPESIRRRFQRVDAGEPAGIIDDFIAHGCPVHFGGMSDPFMPLENKLGVTKEILKILRDYDYPTVISTKSDMLCREEYLDIVRSGRFAVQLSLASLDPNLIRNVDVGTSGVRALLGAASRLAVAGIPVACRIQPLLPGRQSDARELVRICADVGFRHVSVEHLKLPIEAGWKGRQELSDVLGLDLRTHYRDAGSKRDGREWILPLERRLDNILELKDVARRHGVSFGAADNDLLHLSDSECCCSGADILLGDISPWQFNITTAVRRGMRGGIISFDDIDTCWRPNTNMHRYVNSKSRSPSDNRTKSRKLFDDFIKDAWDGKILACSPTDFFGVEESGGIDRSGRKRYQANSALRSLLDD